MNQINFNQQKRGGDEAHSKNWRNYFEYAAFVASAVMLTTFASHNDKNPRNTVSSKVPDSALDEKYASIIVGGGTAGCTVAYLTAKWMQENNILGKVLLVDRGIDFFDAKSGPDPLMGGWYDNWGSYGESHPAERADVSAHPVTVRDLMLKMAQYPAFYVHTYLM